MHLDRQLANKLAEEKRLHKSLIRISYSMGRSDWLMDHIFPRFFERFPDIEIKAKGDTSRKSMMALQNGDMDMVLVTNVERIPGYRYISIGVGCQKGFTAFEGKSHGGRLPLSRH